MKSCICSIVVLAVFLSTSAVAAEKPAIDIPVYPGGETTLEINLTGEEFLPVMQTMLALLSGKMGELVDKIKPEDIVEALKDLKRIEVLQIDVPGSSVTELDVAAFYSKNIPSGKWNKVFWQSSNTLGTVAVYFQEHFRGLYGFRVSTAKVQGKPVTQVTVGKVDGKVDFVKLLTLAGKLVTTS